MADRIIFLDIDGVLSITQSNQLFDSGCCGRLREIIEKSGAKIVLTSSWRRSEQGMALVVSTLELNGISRQDVIGATVDLTLQIKPRTELEFIAQRWQEIMDYIANHDTTTFVILDDLQLSRFAPSNAVQTDIATGITEQVKERCIQILTSDSQ